MSPTRREDDNLGYLRATLESLARRVDEGFEDAKAHRCAVRKDLAEISGKVDPLLADVATLKLEHRAFEVTLNSISTHWTEFEGARKYGKALFRWALYIGGAVAIVWNDQIKIPFQKLLSLFRIG